MQMQKAIGNLLRFANWLGRLIEKRAAWILAVYSLAFLSITCLFASLKLIWFDEIFTLEIAKLPRPQDIWTVLAQGKDPHPPLGYFLTRLFLQLFGEGSVPLRLPAILGFWAMTLCVYVFVARRAGPLFGFVGMMIPLATGVFQQYAFEGRPYGAPLGFCGLALVCWQSCSSENKRPWMWHLGLTICLMALTSLHYYSVLVFVPLGLAEVVRCYRERRWNVLTWMCFVIGLAPLLAYYPLVQAAKKVFSGGFWMKPRWLDFPYFYQYLTANDFLPWFLLLVFAALFPMINSVAKAKKTEGPLIAILPEEIVLALTLAFLPFGGVLLAKIATGVYFERYVLAAVVGFAIFIALIAYRYSANSTGLAVGFIMILGGWIAAKGIDLFQDLAARKAEFATRIELLAGLETNDVPIAVSDVQSYLQLVYYSPRPLKARLVYLTSSDLAKKYIGADTGERAIQALGEFYPLRVEEFDSFLLSGKPFLAYSGGSGPTDWLNKALVEREVRVKKIGRDLAEVTPLTPIARK